MEEIEFYIDATQETMEGAIKHLNIELSKIRAGKASTSMLDGLMIDYYGMPTPISGAASITHPMRARLPSSLSKKEFSERLRKRFAIQA
jgi:ribosome recycling factor